MALHPLPCREYMYNCMMLKYSIHSPATQAACPSKNTRPLRPSMPISLAVCSYSIMWHANSLPNSHFLETSHLVLVTVLICNLAAPFVHLVLTYLLTSYLNIALTGEHYLHNVLPVCRNVPDFNSSSGKSEIQLFFWKSSHVRL